MATVLATNIQISVMKDRNAASHTLHLTKKPLGVPWLFIVSTYQYYILKEKLIPVVEYNLKVAPQYLH